jgi:hypothetical protein
MLTISSAGEVNRDSGFLLVIHPLDPAGGCDRSIEVADRRIQP